MSCLSGPSLETASTFERQRGRAIGKRSRGEGEQAMEWDCGKTIQLLLLLLFKGQLRQHEVGGGGHHQRHTVTVTIPMELSVTHSDAKI